MHEIATSQTEMNKMARELHDFEITNATQVMGILGIIYKT